MASSWLDSWGTSWGTSWGADAPAPSPAPSPVATQPTGGWYIPKNHREEEYQRELIRQEKAELRRIEEELAEAERQKQALEALKKAKKKAEKERTALLTSLGEEISRLRNERVWLMRRIDENEAILVLAIMARRRRFSTLH